MTFFLRKPIALSFIAFFVLGLAITPSAFASIMDYQDYVQGLSETLVQYDFDGSTAAEQQSDKVGSNDLIARGTGITLGVAGFDSTSLAFAPGSDAAFLTESAINLPAAGTSYEAIVQVNSQGDLTQYAVAAFNGSNRSYFTSATAHGNLDITAGNATANYVHAVEGYTLEDWYYIAVTMSYNSGTNQTTINTYSANLSDETPVLSHTITNAAKVGTFSLNLNYGIGALYNNKNGADTLQDFFAGNIDEVTFYSGVKDSTFFEANLGRIMTPVPEPGTMTLLLGIFLSIALIRRR